MVEFILHFWLSEKLALLCVHRKYLIFLFRRSKNKHELVLSQNVKLKKRCWSPDRPPGANDHAPHRESGEENSARRQHDQTGKQVKTGPLSYLCKTVAKHCLRLRTTVTKRCDRKGWNKKKKGCFACVIQQPPQTTSCESCTDARCWWKQSIFKSCRLPCCPGKWKAQLKELPACSSYQIWRLDVLRDLNL